MENKGFHILPKESQPNAKEVFKNALSIIEYSFSINNENFFSFLDFNATPMDRAFNALTHFNEMDMRCDRDFLTAHATAVDNLINDTKAIKLTEIVKLNLQLKERLEFLFEPDIAYKLCSVVFFDETENPHRYEYKKALSKAQLFRTTPISDFFLSKPIGRFVPLTNLSINDFQPYCEVIMKATRKQLENISTMLSAQDKNKEWYKRLESHLQEALAIPKLENLVSMSTT